MGQISIVLIAGLIFLFFFEPSRGAGEFNQLLTLISTVAATILPPALVYLLGSYATRALPDRSGRPGCVDCISSNDLRLSLNVSC